MLGMLMIILNLFEAWQEFASSSSAQGSFTNLSTQSDTKATSYEHASGAKSLDLQDMIR